MDKIKKGVESAISEQMKVAGDGYLPPEPVLTEIERRVRAIGDPMLAAKYDAMVRNAQLTQSLRRAPPLAIEEEARRLRDAAAKGGATKEMDEAIKHVEKLGESVRKAVNDDPMTWAHRNRIETPVASLDGLSVEQMDAAQPMRAPVQLEQLDFRSEAIGAQLAYRMNQAKGVGAYYGQPPQVFTKNEREFLKDTLRQGGRGMLAVLGHINAAASSAGIEPSQIMKEFSKDAPEVAVIGGMVAANADPAILDTAAAALAWRTKQGDKFESTIDKAQAKPDLGDYADVLATSPTSVDAVKHTANLIYEYEARRQGLKEFNAKVYSNVVRRVMGETSTPDGKVFGGVGQQGTGWTDGKWKSDGWLGSTPKVLVPPDVRQNGFDDMVQAVREVDLKADPPYDKNGKPLSAGAVRGAIWISVGQGLYSLKLGENPDKSPQLAVTQRGTPYAIDVRPMLPAIKRRVPHIFRDWDGVSHGRPEADPEPPSGDAGSVNMMVP